MKRIECYGRKLTSLVSKTFEKVDVLGNTNLPKSINPLLLIISLTGLSIYQLTSATVYFNSPGNLINNTISSLVYAPNGWLQTMAFYILSISIMALGILLQFKAPVKMNLGAISIALIGFAFFLIGTCPTQYPDDPLIAGIHGWATRAVIILLPIAGFLVAAVFKRWNYRFLFLYTMINSILQILFILAGGYFLIIQNDLFGLFERVLLGNGQMWLTVICLNFLLAETKHDFPGISSNNPITKPVLYSLLYVYGSMLWPLSLSLLK